MPPKATVAPVTKFVPVMVTAVPAAVVACPVGLSAVTVGNAVGNVTALTRKYENRRLRPHEAGPWVKVKAPPARGTLHHIVVRKVGSGGRVYGSHTGGVGESPEDLRCPRPDTRR